MQGFTDAEIIGSPTRGKPGMLPHYTAPLSGPNSYMKSFVYRIPSASEAFFRELREEAPHAA